MKHHGTTTTRPKRKTSADRPATTCRSPLAGDALFPVKGDGKNIARKRTTRARSPSGTTEGNFGFGTDSFNIEPVKE